MYGWTAVSAELHRDSQGRPHYQWCRRPDETGTLMKAESDRLLMKCDEAKVRRGMLTCEGSYRNHILYYSQTRTQNSSSSPLWSVHVGGKSHTPLPGLAPG